MATIDDKRLGFRRIQIADAGGGDQWRLGFRRMAIIAVRESNQYMNSEGLYDFCSIQDSSA